MTPTEFAIFKYQHTDPATRSQKRIWFAGGSLAIAVLVNWFVGFGPAAALLVLPLVAWFSAPRQLQLGPRYLLCGNTIIYYANVRKANLSNAQGKLRLVCANGKAFVLERDKFPTNARKADKISKNKAAKFQKVANKVIEKVRSASAKADFSGL